MLRKLLRAVGRVLLFFFVVMGAYLAYGAYAEPKAKQQAKDFCATVKTGEDPAAVVERARAAGAEKVWLRWRDVKDGERSLMVMFIGLPPFSRHICHVRARSAVIGASTTYMD